MTKHQMTATSLQQALNGIYWLRKHNEEQLEKGRATMPEKKQAELQATIDEQKTAYREIEALAVKSRSGDVVVDIFEFG